MDGKRVSKIYFTIIIDIDVFSRNYIYYVIIRWEIRIK